MTETIIFILASSAITWFVTWRTMKDKNDYLNEINKALRERIKVCNKYHTVRVKEYKKT